jgi:hypothetical protein
MFIIKMRKKRWSDKGCFLQDGWDDIMTDCSDEISTLDVLEEDALRTDLNSLPSGLNVLENNSWISYQRVCQKKHWQSHRSWTRWDSVPLANTADGHPWTGFSKLAHCSNLLVQLTRAKQLTSTHIRRIIRTIPIAGDITRELGSSL